MMLLGGETRDRPCGYSPVTPVRREITEGDNGSRSTRPDTPRVSERKGRGSPVIATTGNPFTPMSRFRNSWRYANGDGLRYRPDGESCGAVPCSAVELVRQRR